MILTCPLGVVIVGDGLTWGHVWQKKIECFLPVVHCLSSNSNVIIKVKFQRCVFVSQLFSFKSQWQIQMHCLNQHYLAELTLP